MTFHDAEAGRALARWQERLTSYLDGQEGIEALRSRIQPFPPWPEADNPMLGYLDRPSHGDPRRGRPGDGHHLGRLPAWFEFAIDTRAGLIRHLGA